GAKRLYFLNRAKGTFDRFVGIAQLKGLAHREWKPEVADRFLIRCFLRPAEIGDDRQQLRPGVPPVQFSQHLRRIRHLRDGPRGDITSEIQRVEPDREQRVQKGGLLFRGNDMRPALHGVARAFDEGQQLFHIRCRMASYKMIPAATETLNESNSPAMGMVKTSSAAFRK